MFIREILTPDLVLPHYIAAVDTADPSLSCQIVIEYLAILVQASTSFTEREQFAAIVHCLAKQLEMYMKVGKLGSSQQEDIEFNSIGIIKVLRSRSTL